MKYILFLFPFIWSVVSHAQADYTFDSPYRTFAEGSQQYILNPNTLLRLAPSFEALVCDSLAVGKSVEIVERMDEISRKNGFINNWYAIDYYKNKEKITAYIWGGAIAIGWVKQRADNILFLYGIDSLKMKNRGNYEEEVIQLKLNVCTQNTLLYQLKIMAVGTIYTQTQLSILNRSGLNGVRSVLELAFSDGYCGGVSATMVLFWNGRKLDLVRLLSNGFSEQEFRYQFWIYPREEGGQKGLITERNQSGSFGANRKPIVKEQKDILYFWNGEQLEAIKQ